MRAWAQFVLERRRLVVAVWFAAVLIALPAASRLSDELSGGGYAVPGSESDRASAAIHREIQGGIPRQPLYVVVPVRPGRLAAERGARARTILRGTRGVASVGAARVAPSGATALVPFEYAGSFDAAQRALPELRHRLESLKGAEITGQAAIFRASTDLAAADLAKAERLSLPITLGILSVAFLSVIAAGLPILLALCALSVTFAALVGVTQLVETNAFVTNSAVLLGLGLSIDYSLFIVSRYRELRSTEVDVDSALMATLTTTGRAVAFSGVTVAVSLVSLTVVGVDLFTSMAIGATIASLVAALAALTLLPALLRMLGPRIDLLRLRRTARVASRARLWKWLSAVVLRHRLALAVLVAIALLMTAAPLTDLHLGFPSTNGLLPDPGSDSVAAATHRVEHDFGTGALAPFQVVTRSDPRRVGQLVAADPTVQALLAPVRGAHGWTEVRAVSRDEDNTPQARDALDRLRHSLHTRFPGTLVGGRTAEGEDLARRVADRFPLVVALAAVTTFALLFFAFRSLVVPLKAVATNVLTVGAALGLVTAIFQWVGGSDAIAHFVPLFLFAVLFGLSMDYEVFLISRIRDEHLAGHGSDESIARGLVRSARPITLAAIVMITVFASSAVSQFESFQQLGVGMSLAVLIDATAVRCVLVPAVMALLGSRNWWAPRALARLLPSEATTASPAGLGPT